MKTFNDYEFKFMNLEELRNGQIFFYQTKQYKVDDFEMPSCSCRRTIDQDGHICIYPLSLKVSAVINK